MTPRPDPRAWLAATPDRLRPALEGCATGALPANIALLRLAIEAVRPDEIEVVLAQARDRASKEPPPIWRGFLFGPAHRRHRRADWRSCGPCPLPAPSPCASKGSSAQPVVPAGALRQARRERDETP